MKRTMCGIHAKIGHDDDLDDLKPCRLLGHGLRQACRNEQSGGADDRHKEHAADEIDRDAIEDVIGKVVENPLSKYLLLRSKGKDPLQWNEDQRPNQQRFEPKDVHLLLPGKSGASEAPGRAARKRSAGDRHLDQRVSVLVGPRLVSLPPQLILGDQHRIFDRGLLW
ncbi:hypothetical protein [Mesorhizobium sp. B2-4-17]|uniref:hypothetical protein n=1 Tax=Mesorhizobium sp. B2-4-17 TaxID=2589932 RepID=UPI001FED95C6|nr:hypothetical protein [Mesorhizobium sp. B2-4-17]